METPQSKMLKTRDVCHILNISDKTLMKWRKAGKIQGYKPGRDWKYKQEDVQALLERTKNTNGN